MNTSPSASASFDAFVPSFDQVVVEVYETPDEIKGVAMPETSKRRTQKARILAIGPGRHTVNGEFIATVHKPGQIVAYSKYSGSPMKIDDREVLIMSERDILGVFKTDVPSWSDLGNAAQDAATKIQGLSEAIDQSGQ